MGKKSFPIIRNWVTGRDIHTYLDVFVSEVLIQRHYPDDEILNMNEIDCLLEKTI
jgi:N-acylneuraminate cytidylyltransferase